VIRRIGVDEVSCNRARGINAVGECATVGGSARAGHVECLKDTRGSSHESVTQAAGHDDPVMTRASLMLTGTALESVAPGASMTVKMPSRFRTNP